MLNLDVQISLVDMLYRKSLRITAASKGRMGVGAIVNLQSNDASKLWGMAQYLHILWSGPFQVISPCVLLAFCPRNDPFSHDLGTLHVALLASINLTFAGNLF